MGTLKFVKDSGEVGFDKKIFYYIGAFAEDHPSSSKTKKVATVCLLMKNNEVLSRGVSITSPRDQFNGKVGRAKAFGRAIQAAVNCRNDGDIKMGTWNQQFPIYLTLQSTLKYKSCYKPELTETEKCILFRKKTA